MPAHLRTFGLGVWAIMSLLAAGAFLLSPFWHSADPDLRARTEAEGMADYRFDPPVEVGPPDLDPLGLLHRLQESNLRLHVVSLREQGNEFQHGYYLCEQPRDWESVAGLSRIGNYHRWQGVVAVQRRGLDTSVPLFQISQIQEWGAHALLTRQMVLFGDPNLLARLRALLKTNHENTKDENTK